MTTASTRSSSSTIELESSIESLLQFYLELGICSSQVQLSNLNLVSIKAKLSLNQLANIINLNKSSTSASNNLLIPLDVIK
jgi:predicted transcriptional regulator